MNARPNIRRPLPFLLLVLLCCGCGPALLHDPALLESAARAAGDPGGIWSPAFKGMDAAIIPEGSPGGFGEIALNAVYRLDAAGLGAEKGAKFALFLPQGGKVGQCLREGGETECLQHNYPGLEKLVRNAFAALDEAARLVPLPADAYELREGDRLPDGDPGPVLLRRRGAARVVYDASGKPLAAEKRGNDTDGPGWKLFFTDAGWRFVPAYGPSLLVEPLRLITENK